MNGIPRRAARMHDGQESFFRLLRRLILAKRYLLGISRLRPEDVWLAAYPKTGSSWLRAIIAGVLRITHDRGIGLDLTSLDEVLPTLGGRTFPRTWSPTTVPRSRYGSVWGPSRGITQPSAPGPSSAPNPSFSRILRPASWRTAFLNGSCERSRLQPRQFETLGRWSRPWSHSG